LFFEAFFSFRFFFLPLYKIFKQFQFGKYELSNAKPMKKNIFTTTEQDYENACAEIDTYLSENDGVITKPEVKKIAKKFDADFDKLWEEVSYQRKLVVATTKAFNSLRSIANECEIEIEDLELGIIKCIEGYRENFNMAIDKTMDTIMSKQMKFSNTDFQNIAQEFDINLIELKHVIKNMMIEMQENK
jgi:hypothetical protein